MTTTNTTDRRKYSIFGDAIKLLNDNDPNAIHPDNAEAGANIMALARLAAHKAFCEVGVWHETRQKHYYYAEGSGGGGNYLAICRSGAAHSVCYRVLTVEP